MASGILKVATNRKSINEETDFGKRLLGLLPLAVFLLIQCCAFASFPVIKHINHSSIFCKIVGSKFGTNTKSTYLWFINNTKTGDSELNMKSMVQLINLEKEFCNALFQGKNTQKPFVFLFDGNSKEYTRIKKGDYKDGCTALIRLYGYPLYPIFFKSKLELFLAAMEYLEERGQFVWIVLNLSPTS